MAFSDALAALAAISPSGVVTKYGMSEIPGAVGNADLPALVILPHNNEKAFIPYDSNLTYGIARISILHVLLAESGGSGRTEDRYHFVTSLISNYFSAIGDNWDMSGHLMYPTQINYITIGDIEYSGVHYRGAEFIHDWVLKL